MADLTARARVAPPGARQVRRSWWSALRRRWDRASVLQRDLVIAGTATALAAVELVTVADQVEGPLAGHLTGTLLLLPTLGLRRLAPLAAAATAALALAANVLAGSAPVAVPYLCLLFFLVSLGWYAETRRGVVGLGLILLGGATYDVFVRFVLADLVVNVVLLVAAWAAGRAMRLSVDRRLAAELARDRAARDAVAAERSRLARDLHDSTAHALTLITLQAGAARERSEQEESRATLGSIERGAREALADMQRLVRVLGDDTDEAPGLADLAELVERVGSAGLEVEVVGDPGPVPASVSTTAYRVVQEALTNVLRHSDARRVRVELGREDRCLVLRVRDDGGPVQARTTASGRGLAGLRERLALFDGELVAGQDPEGGWSVRASVPLAGFAP